jgi:hypothetical protein
VEPGQGAKLRLSSAPPPSLPSHLELKNKVIL